MQALYLFLCVSLCVVVCVVCEHASAICRGPSPPLNCAAGPTVCGNVLQTRALSHPLPVMRAREIDRWSQSSQFRTLIARN